MDLIRNKTRRNNPGMATGPAIADLNGPVECNLAAIKTIRRHNEGFDSEILETTGDMSESQNNPKQISGASSTGLPGPRSTRSAKRPSRARNNLFITSERSLETRNYGSE
jgi:hypothetical protein